MIKMKLLIMLSIVVHISGMDAPQAQGSVKNKLLIMVIYNQKEQLEQLLKEEGVYAQSLVSSHRSHYGTILDAAYIESKQDIREIIVSYMSEESLVDCFEERKKDLHAIWEYNALHMEPQKKASHESIPCVKSSADLVLIPSIDLIPIPSTDLSRKPSAEAIVRDLYQKDSVRFPLSPYECEKLGINR